MKQELKNINIPASIDTPKILLNSTTGILSFEGKSFPPDVAQFFERTTNWIQKYLLGPAEKTVVNLKLDYFNTASSKIILDLLYKFEELKNQGNDVVVKWYYPEDDEDMEETGIEYSEIVDVPFEQISYTYTFD